MKVAIPLAILLGIVCQGAFGTPATAKKLNALYEQVDAVRQSGDPSKLSQLRDQVEALNQRIAAGRPDTGCFDASGMLRAMPANIQLQWQAGTADEASRHQKFWRELNEKYVRYEGQCSQAR